MTGHRYGSKAHLRALRTQARRELGSGPEPPSVEQLLRAAEVIDEAIGAQTLSSFARLMVADGRGYACTPREFIRARLDEHPDYRRRPPSVRLVRERNDLDSLPTFGLGAQHREDES
jgi:hypothetical protein